MMHEVQAGAKNDLACLSDCLLHNLFPTVLGANRGARHSVSPNRQAGFPACKVCPEETIRFTDTHSL